MQFIPNKYIHRAVITYIRSGGPSTVHHRAYNYLYIYKMRYIFRKKNKRNINAKNDSNRQNAMTFFFYIFLFFAVHQRMQIYSLANKCLPPAPPTHSSSHAHQTTRAGKYAALLFFEFPRVYFYIVNRSAAQRTFSQAENLCLINVKTVHFFYPFISS